MITLVTTHREVKETKDFSDIDGKWITYLRATEAHHHAKQ
jgi:hypothetical protein